MLKTISPAEAARLLREEGATLVDVREPDEHARQRIPGARNLPLSKLEEAELAVHQGKPVLFHCRSGARTEGHAERLAAKAGPECEAYIVEGGLEAWKKAGLPVAEDRRQPLEVMRQVQIVAGTLVLLGVVLGALVSPWFYALSAFVGAGLVQAGVTGACPMAALLRRMPWNRRFAAA
ncbi:rhodanese family protein [Caldovatus aquaticus]|uniref:Rhodanese family protein n=1 Tax=Caldovatus aquaticus TaxID=2865671 RepID=A0ABS7F2E5_9PROT|nr:rhodanese family protein [Caldovatus aquaticus]MBW8269729.1 rhodanese family protein [Caldovatus aquaticus]